MNIIKKKYIPSKAIRGLLIAVLVIASFLTVPTDDVNEDTNSDEDRGNISITNTIEDINAQQTESFETESQVQETETSVPETLPAETQAPETEPPVVETQPPETTPVIVEPTIPENSTFSIHFIDVGQADAALVECDGRFMLIDGGNKDDSSLIYTVLKNAKIEKLDIVVATHAHEDHVGGIPGAYNYASAGLTLCPVTVFDTDAFSDFKKYADSKGGGITVPSVGDKYAIGSASVEILGVNSTDDANSCSIVLMITYGETKFLFTGDA